MASWRSQFGPACRSWSCSCPASEPFPPRRSSRTGRTSARLSGGGRGRRPRGLAVTIDIGERDNIHPANKQDVGRRLTRAARQVIYGEAIARRTRSLSARREPTAVVVTFGDVERNLVSYSSSQAIGFELCGAGPGSCRFVIGEVDGSRVVLRPPSTPDWAAVRVRFCWGPSPLCNLTDGSGLQLVRSRSW